MDDGIQDAQEHLIHVDAPAARLAHAGVAANAAAQRGAFAEFRSRLAPHTRRRHDGDLRVFARYLTACGLQIVAAALGASAEPWRGMTWGLLAGFVRWQLQEGYAIGSLNVRLSTVKRYCQLAHQAEVLSAEAYSMIKTVRVYSRREGRRLDAERHQTRKGPKKAQAVHLNGDLARALKQQPDTPQGRRDALIMSLLLDHGLRVGELAGLAVDAFDLKAGTFTFYRPKVDKMQVHKLTADTQRAALSYLQQDALASGPLLLGAERGGRLHGTMGARAITRRVAQLGAAMGFAVLSPHDCRHYWATAAVRGGTDIKALQDAGGWASPIMPLQYVESARVANQGVKLDEG